MIMSATTKNNDVLYGNEISRKRKEKLGDQLYETFLREITCGRWAVGERLPSYQELAKMSGLSRTPIEATLTRLED
jgi:DNA-binding FadR family transcriptional regulator